MKKDSLFRRWWPSALVVVVILYATLFPDPAGADALPRIPAIDKLVHAVMFGGFAGALAFDWSRCHGRIRPFASVMLKCCAASLLLGGIIEIVQEVMHIGRSGDVIDFLADAAGIAVAYFTAPPAIAAVLRRK